MKPARARLCWSVFVWLVLITVSFSGFCSDSKKSTDAPTGTKPGVNSQEPAALSPSAAQYIAQRAAERTKIDPQPVAAAPKPSSASAPKQISPSSATDSEHIRIDALQSDLGRLHEVLNQVMKENEELKASQKDHQESSSTNDAAGTNVTPPASEPAESPTSVSVSPVSATKEHTEYWLTSKSNKRHNSTCVYFGKSLGKKCTPEEGSPCRLCGG